MYSQVTLRALRYFYHFSININERVAVVQSLNHVWHIVIPWIAARQISLSFTISQSLLKLMSLESGMPSNHCIFCCTILLLPSVLPSITVFFLWVSSSHHVAKVLEFQFQHQSFLWVFGVDFLLHWLVWSPWCPRDSQESSPTPEFENSNSSAFSLLYSLTLKCIHDYWKNYSFDYMDFFGKVMSLLLNTLSTLVIAIIPRNKCLSYHSCHHHLQYIWSPRKWNLTPLPHFPHLFAMKW